MENKHPNLQEVLKMFRQNSGGKLPKSLELSAELMPEMVFEHARSSQFAMSPDNPLGMETSILVYIGIALATGSYRCIDIMMTKAKMLNIPKEKILATIKIARISEATRVLGNADTVLERIIKDY